MLFLFLFVTCPLERVASDISPSLREKSVPIIDEPGSVDRVRLLSIGECPGHDQMTRRISPHLSNKRLTTGRIQLPKLPFPEYTKYLQKQLTCVQTGRSKTPFLVFLQSCQAHTLIFVAQPPSLSSGKSFVTRPFIFLLCLSQTDTRTLQI